MPHPLHKTGGWRELMTLALPLIISQSFSTLQVTIDRMLLSWNDPDAVAASMPAMLLFWIPMALLQNTANYATTFVAQYLGAGRKHRVGPAVWQAIHFSVLAGAAFPLFLFVADDIIAAGGHTPRVMEQELIYFRCLCFSALPFLIVASVSSFFAGRGESWTVCLINAVGMIVNAVLDYAWIYGYWGFPAWGIAGAGWATVVGASVSAALALVLLLRRKYRDEFATLSGWKFEAPLFWRLMAYGLPTGLQWMLDVAAITVFTFVVGKFGAEALASTSVAFTVNIVFILPMLGIAQAVSILVGQRLGEDRPEAAAQSAWTGFRIAWAYMTTISVLLVCVPDLFIYLFQSRDEVEKWAIVADHTRVLLRFVAAYTLFDSMNLVFSFALRGAGDTRFVTKVMLVLPWPIMVLPTWAAWYYGWGLYWAWSFITAYVIVLALTFLGRFLVGKWKTMRVIEPVVVDETVLATQPLEAIAAE